MIKIKKILKTGIFALSMASLFAISAYAKDSTKEVSSVSLSIAPNKTVASELEPGDILAGCEPTTTASGYSISDWKVSTSDYTLKYPYYYTISVSANDGYKFADKTTATVSGANTVSIENKSNKKLTLKVKAYPFSRLSNPTGFTRDENDLISWTKVKGADKYKIIVHYSEYNETDDEYKDRTTTTTVENNRINITSYMDKYEDVYISVQAMGSESSAYGKYMLPSDFINADTGEVDDSQSVTRTIKYPSASTSTSDTKTAVNFAPGTSSSGTTVSTNNSEGPGVSKTEAEANQNGWAGTGNEWRMLQNGKVLTKQWYKDAGDGKWYYLNEDGKMAYGWNQIDGKWYYLNLSHDRTFGAMQTGWVNSNENWYYLGEDGAMWYSTVTPDGYTVNENGQWVH